jgi:hypothetical protein
VTTDLTTRGRRVRVLATVACLALLVAGTLWGQDDHFPFGPFRMYSTSPDPNGAAKDTRVEGVDSTGRIVAITEANSGIRRAEIEGQQAAYQADPSRLSRIAEAYAEHTPGAPALREVRIVIRWHGIRDARPTGTYTDEVIADWTRP